MRVRFGPGRAARRGGEREGLERVAGATECERECRAAGSLLPPPGPRAPHPSRQIKPPSSPRSVLARLTGPRRLGGDTVVALPPLSLSPSLPPWPYILRSGAPSDAAPPATAGRPPRPGPGEPLEASEERPTGSLRPFASPFEPLEAVPGP